MIGSAYLFAYSSYIYDKDWQVEYSIAQTKASYNADAGIALDAYTVLFKKDYLPSINEDIAQGLVEPDCGEDPKCMGSYEVVRFEDIDDQTYQIIRGCTSTGSAKVRKHILGNELVNVTSIRNMTLGHTSSLAKYQYLTRTENAGGGPWVWGLGDDCTEENRRSVSWGTQDAANDGWNGQDLTCDISFHTNGTFEMSQFGAPTFDITMSVTQNADGTYNSPNMNGNNPNIFQGDPPLDTVKTVCLPPPGYKNMKRIIETSNDHVFLDATDKLKWLPGYFQRDTLIMTDIEFFVVPNSETSGFNVKQWWYLIPPYLGSGPISGLEMPSPNCFNMGNGSFGSAANTAADCSNFARVYTCDRYKEQLKNFHSTIIDDNIPANESGVGADNDNCISGNDGFKHFDVPDMYKLYAEDNWVSQFEVDDISPFGAGAEDHLLPEYVAHGGFKTYYYQHPTAIYVKGGSVRVKGTYKGRYTIVTDEFQTYKRHAWGAGYLPPNKEDTLWTDIWLTGDLVNDDAIGSSLLAAQPDISCSDDTGSDNRMGLVSGSNIYIANTPANGARSGELSYCPTGHYNPDRSNINIHAHMIAFNESFATQYSNNTYDNDFVGGGTDDDFYSTPPFGDGQGLLKYGGTSGNTCNQNSGDGNDGAMDCNNYPNQNCFPMPDGSNDDDRGTITVWGGIVQDLRGYVVRNAPGPYNTGNIGYGKSYNFDCNLECPEGTPPLYPESTNCDESTDETQYKVTAYY